MKQVSAFIFVVNVLQLAAGADVDLPAPVVELIEHALAVAADTSMPPKNPAAFERALDQLAKGVDSSSVATSAANEGRSIRAKIIVVAQKRSENPEPFRSIYDYYVVNALSNYSKAHPGVRSLPAVIPTPPIDLQHIGPEFRLSWECYLLIEWVRGASEDFLSTTLEALIAIGDPRSVPAIAYRLKRLAVDPRGDFGPLIRALAYLPSEDGLRALLHCVEFAEKSVAVRHEKASILIPGLEVKIDPRQSTDRDFPNAAARIQGQS